MKMFTKFAISGALALALTASSLGALPARADDGGAVAAGILTGLVVGGILLNTQHHRRGPQVQFYGNAGYGNGPDCYEGPVRSRWEQVCHQDEEGETECQNVREYYRPQICN